MFEKSSASASGVFFVGQTLKNSDDWDLRSLLGTSRRMPGGTRSFVAVAMAFLLLGAFSVSARAQVTLAPNWYQLSPANVPAARWNGASAYDSAHSQLVMFGGFENSVGTNSETWLWNGTTWSQANPATVPGARSSQAMAYDPVHGQVVMFGGANSGGTRLNETWLWNGTNWTNVVPANSPSARNGTTMVYDPALGGIVLFGGLDGTGTVVGDTWLWDGTNWSPVSSGQTPAVRFNHSMAYDAAHSQVVLFGGMSGTYLNDTWVLSAAGWAQENPANIPGARYGQGMDYDAALGQVVMFGGYNGSAYVNDTWMWNGTNWTLQSPATSPSPSFATNAMVYDAAEGAAVMFGGYAGGSPFNTTWVWSTDQNFGSINVCPSGQSTPAPCSNTLSLTYNFTSTTTIGSIQVVTQGASNLDFTQANGGSCAGTISGGSSCTLVVTFTPIAPGLRMGAVEIFDNLGNLLVTSMVSGIGQGPAVAFSPATQTTVGTGWNQPQGVAVDAAGNVFVSNLGSSQVSKLPPGGAQTTVPVTGLASPFGVAVDGAGNLFIADPGNHQVVKVTPSGVQSTVGSVTIPYGVAADGAGNVYIVDSEISNVVKVTAAGVQTTLPFTNLVNPYYVAVDSVGNVYVNDATNLNVVKLTPAGVQTTLPITGLSCPYGVAVDAADDVFVADPCLGQVIEVTPSGVQSSTTGLVQPISLAVDGAGDIFTGNELSQGTVTEVNRSQPPTVTFDTTYVGNFSDDSPKSVTVQNIGNQTLSHVAPGLIVAGSPYAQTFGSTPLTDCTSTFSLAPGGECDLSISFRPTSQGTYGSVTVFTDNALNVSGAQQVIYLYGSGLNQTETLTLSGAGSGNGSVSSSPFGINCNILGGVASGTCSAGYPGGEGVSLEEIPSSGYTFVGWGGDCASAGASQFCNINTNVNTSTNVTANFAPSATYALTLTEAGTGSGTVGDNQSQISCGLAGGSETGTCTGNYPGGTLVTLTANANGTSTFLGWGGACASAGTGLTCSLTVNQVTNVTASFENINFGNVNVCPAGQNTPAPCSNTLALTYNLATTTTIGAIQVVTQGVAGLDFTLGNGSTCTGTVSGGSSCNVNVNFTPLAPGWRMGAATLFDNNGNPIATTPIYGNGQAPKIAFGPGTQTPINTGGYTLSQPKGLLIDAAGNLFISDTVTQQVVKIAPNGTATTVGFGFQFPQGLAEDGAGDLFVGDNNAGQVVEIPAGCNSAACQIYLGTTFGSQLGVAADGAGDVFFDDYGTGQAIKIPAGCGASTACQQVVYNPGGNSHPVDLTADAAGDLFIADHGLQQVIEVPAGCANSNCQIAIGSGWSQPDDVAVDAAGDVFVADEGLNEIVEVPAGCTVPACQVVVVSGVNTVAVAVDASGDLVVDDLNNSRVFVVNRSQLPSLSFALTNVGSTSTDSPQLVSIQNVGNQPLTGSLNLNLGANFVANVSSTCTNVLLLAPGAGCNESFNFTPQTTGYLTGTASFSDNTLNLSPLVVLQTINLSGNGGLNGQPVGVAVPNVVGLTPAAATSSITGAGLTMGTVSNAASSIVPTGSVIESNPAAGTQVSIGSAVRLLVSTGVAPPPTPNPLTLENNYFVTGDFASAGVTLRGTGVGGTATGTITIPDSTTNPGVSQGVPDGADILEAFLYWETVENTPSPSSANVTFNGYSISGQQIGSDVGNYTDGTLTGTLRVYRADVNAYFPIGANGVRFASGSFKVSLPDGGGTVLPLTEGASLVVLYRVLSPNFPLKSVVIYDGSGVPASSTTQTVQGFYDALGGSPAESTTLFDAPGAGWSNSSSPITLSAHASQFSVPLNAGNAYAAVIFSTPVTNSDNDGILDAWKAGPAAGDFYAGGPGYYDVKTGGWVPLPGAVHGEKDLFVQLDYMCGAVLASGACDPNQENLFPAPDAQGNDPLAMVQNAFAADGIVLHLQVGNAVPEDTCTDGTTANSQLCQFPSESGVIGWKNSLELSKLWPRNLASCAAGVDCSPRFPYGQKDSYHYVLVGHSLAIPAWNTRYGTLTSIQVVSGVTTIGTTNRGAANSINYCPSRITISGVLGNPNLNGVYNTTSCPDAQTIIVATPGVANWSYPNSTLPEPVIGLTSGTVTSISGYSDLGGSDSAVTLGLWETAPNQDMSKRSNVIAGTLFHEIGHTLGLGHGGLYYQTPGSYIPNFDVNCKPNYQSVMNYLFQLDGVGPNAAVAFSNQTLETLSVSSLASVTNLTDGSLNPATFPTSAWYTQNAPSPTSSPATLHCDGTPLNGDVGYRVNGSIAPVTPSWSNGQNIAFDGVPYTQMLGYNDVANLDLRQVGATAGEFASEASVLSFGSSQAPLSVAAGGTVAMGSGGTIALGSGGTVALGSGGNVTLGSGGTIALGSGGTVTLGSGGNVTLPSTGGTITPGSNGIVALGSGGSATLSIGGTITLGSGGNVTLGSGGIIALGSGGVITSSLGVATIPSTGGPYSYTLPSGGGVIALGSGGTVTLGSGGNVTLGSGGVIAMGSGGTVALGSGGNVTLGSGGTVALGSGGIIALGSGGNVTLGSGGTIALGSGGTVALGSGGNVTLGSGGIVTLGSGGNVTLGSGGNVTLGSGGTVTLGSGGNVTLGSGGNVTLGSGGIIAMGSGGTVALGSGGTVTLGSGGIIALGSGGTPTPVGPGVYTIPAGGGTITLGSGGTIALGSGGNVTLGSGGTITMGSGGTVTLGSGGNVTLGSGGVVALGSGGNVTLGSGGTIALGSGGNVTLGSGGATTNELTYETANSVVRPPSSPTETPVSAPTGTVVIVNWTAPAFGVVSTYTISRSSDGATPIVIGSVSGVGGNPPATTFTDTNPDLISQTVVYTISTTLLPVQIDPTQRQSAPSPPAVLTNAQTIVLGSLPSSVTISSSPFTVTATAQTNGAANGLQVLFSATGSCAVGSQSIDQYGVSSASVALNSTGSCTISATQPGTNLSQPGNPPYYNPANSVSGTFMILPQGSNTQSQTINFPQLPNLRYGNTFSLSATSSSGLPVSFMASGQCTAGGAIIGIGVCSITASAPANSTYSAASTTQTFLISPAVLTVTASNVSSPYGQLLPPLTYQYTGFVNNETSAVVSGAPALSTTATSTSSPGNYPITVSTGTMSAANYSFLYVSGTLTINSATATISIGNIPSGAVYGGSFTPAYSYSGVGAPAESATSSTAGVCTVSNGVVSFVGVGPCTLTASATATTDDSAVTGSPQSFTVGKAGQSITFTQPTSPVTYGVAPITLTATATSGLTVAFSVDAASTGTGTIVGNSLTATAAGNLIIDANQTGSTNYVAATQVQRTIVVNKTTATISIGNIPSGAVYGGSFTPTYSYSGIGAPTESVTSSTTAVCTVSNGVVSFVGVGPCTLTASATATTDDSAVTGNPQSFTVSKATVTISISNIPSGAAYGGSFTPAYSYSGAGAPTESVTSSTTGVCTVSSGVVSFVGVGPCTLTASATATTDDLAVTGSPQSFTVGKATPAISIGNLPASAVYGGSFTPTYSYSGVGAPAESAASSTTGVCTISSGVVKFVGVGPCTLTASATATTDDLAATGSPQSFTVSQASQTITFTTNPPASAAYNSSFTVAATGGASGNAVTFTSSGACSNSGATYTMTNSTGTCSVIVNQAGNTNYSTAPQVTDTVNANGPLVTVSPSSISFGTVTQGSITTKNITVTNIGTASVTINQPILSIVQGGNSNEFVAVNLCPTPLAVGKSCTITIAFLAGPYYTPQTATLQIMDNAPGSPQPVTLSATVLVPQTITFTTSPPASAAYNSTFTVAATGGASGNAVTFTSSGACSNSGATYTMTSGTGTCSAIANQAGNSSYASAAQVTKTATATLAAQTITFTTSPPASAAYKSSFTVAATGGASGNAVTFTSSGACSNSGATYTMTSGTGTCSVIANQAGNSNYASAAPVTKTVSATLVAQTITFTTNPPASAANKSSFTVAATGGASGNAVTFTSSGSCTNSGATYKMTSATGTCSVIANQAGNSNYAAAPQVTKTVQ